MDTSNIASTLLHRGAEADLSLATIGPWRVVIKHRVKKEYRNPSLDEQIRHDRTISEASRIHEAKTAGARVPSIVGIDIENNAIVMTYLAGIVARECLDNLPTNEARKLLRSVGAQIGQIIQTFSGNNAGQVGHYYCIVLNIDSNDAGDSCAGCFCFVDPRCL